jgi:hypothetical protein
LLSGGFWWDRAFGYDSGLKARYCVGKDNAQSRLKERPLLAQLPGLQKLLNWWSIARRFSLQLRNSVGNRADEQSASVCF